MENLQPARESLNFGRNLSFIMDHDSGYMSSESCPRPEEEKFVIGEAIPTADNISENAVDGAADIKNWEITSFSNLVNRDNSIINVANSDSNLTKEKSKTQTIPSTPEKKYENPVNPNVSPDLFDEEDESPSHNENTNNLQSESDCTIVKKYIVDKDNLLVKRATKSLKGVLPPHCMTVVNLSINEMLNKIETNKDYFWTSENIGQLSSENLPSTSSDSDGFKSLLITGYKEIVNNKWPEVLGGRYHGLHHNRSHLSEEFESLCAKYLSRYVGDETASTCTVFQTSKISPSKRKLVKQRWPVKSPGRRLSHLARRRITFSSANLQSSSSSVGRARQILVDSKRLDILRKKSPKKTSPRKTPSKSPRKKTRTPSSSAKKKLAARFRILSGEIDSTTSSASKTILSSKRALFQSPDRDGKSNILLPSTSFSFENEQKPAKRALFLSPTKTSGTRKTPPQKSPFKLLEMAIERKRKRSESDDRPSKFPRSLSLDIRPTDSVTKMFNTSLSSDSFCSQNSQPAATSGEMSAAHKKKLQWAVYEALRSQNILPTHNQFKIFASNLARITRRLLPFTGTCKEVGTTERMLRITRYHVHAVIKGRSVDDIVQEYLRNKANKAKPHGYVAIEDFASRVATDPNRKISSSSSFSTSSSSSFNVLQDKANVLASLEKKRQLQDTVKPKVGSIQVERIRKAINFGDDDNR